MYCDELLRVALELSEDRYGPFVIEQQKHTTVLNRQRQNVIAGVNIDVASSMPKQAWLENTRRIPFPLLKGLASYRVFLTTTNHLAALDDVDSLAELSQFKIGQGIGWSTSKILEHHRFDVVYAPTLDSAFRMLQGQRFHLLMRGVYEGVAEVDAYTSSVPDLALVTHFGMFTYLPMYFFVHKENAALAERLEYGLKRAHETGRRDALLQTYFADTLAFLAQENLTLFYLENTNISDHLYAEDEPFLLDSIKNLRAEYTERQSGIDGVAKIGKDDNR